MTRGRAIPEARRVIAIPARGPTEIVATIDLVLCLLLPAGGAEAVLSIVAVEVWAVVDGAAIEDLRCLYHPEMDLTVLVEDRLHLPVVEDGVVHHLIDLIKV